MNCPGLCRQSKTAYLAEELNFKLNRVKQGTVSCSAIDKIIHPNREINHDRKIL